MSYLLERKCDAYYRSQNEIFSQSNVLFAAPCDVLWCFRKVESLKNIFPHKYYILHHDRKSRRFLYEGENSKTDLKEKWEALLLCRGEIKRPLFKKVVSTLPN